MVRKVLSASCALALALAGSSCGTEAKRRPTTPAAQASQTSTEDQQFLSKAIPAGVAEVQFGNLALEKSEDEQVREFAERMVQDHSAANQQLLRLAAAGKTPQAEIDPEHQVMYLHLSGLSGDEFDREYMRGQVQDHQATVELFATEADQPTSSVDHLAGQLLPTLRQHLQMAQEISDSMV